MEFEWDQNKSEKCFTERGFDFAYVIRVFFDPNRLVQRDKRYDYGEKRYQLIGKIDERFFVVIYTLRKRSLRIISARKANTREVRYYHENTAYDY
ncbi:MAG: BrnT family toxin [Thermodesulfobacteriota bacterium]